MKRPTRALALFLLLLMLFQTFSAPALAADTILPQREHLELSFEDLVRFTFSEEDFSLAADEIELFCQDAANSSLVEERLEVLRSQYLILDTQLQMLSIRASQDVFDTQVNEEYLDLMELSYDVDQRMSEVVTAVLYSPLADLIDQNDLVYSLFLWESGPMDRQEQSLYLEEQTLVDQYYAAIGQVYYAEIGGAEYAEDELYDAYLAERISWAEYDDGLLQIAKAQNAATGSLYVSLVENRRAQAALYGYNDYAQLQDDYTYYRDYTRGEISALAAAVKEYIVPVAQALETQLDGDTSAYDFTWDEEDLLKLARQELGDISEELLPALDYMTEYGYYDITWSDAKSAGAYTTVLSYPNAPFLLMEPENDATDFSTLIHEFGHYNAYFCSDDIYMSNLDLGEIHSQGLELLMLEEYGDVFGESAQVLEQDTVWFVLTSLIDGCMMDELERYAYSEPDLTVEKLNQKYAELLKAYGYWEKNDPDEAAYGWVTTSHLFEYPLYYISYAVSAAGAFTIWEQAQTDRQDAIDTYLSLVALGESGYFFPTLRAVGIDNPITRDKIQSLSELLTETYLTQPAMGNGLGISVLPTTEHSGFPIFEFLVLALCFAAVSGTVIFVIVLVTQRKENPYDKTGNGIYGGAPGWVASGGAGNRNRGIPPEIPGGAGWRPESGEDAAVPVSADPAVFGPANKEAPGPDAGGPGDPW